MSTAQALESESKSALEARHEQVADQSLSLPFSNY